MMHFDFAGQRVVVTGGTRGIGRAITEAFLQAGAQVVATYSGNEAAAAEFKVGLPAEQGARLALAKFDVGSYAEAEAFFRRLEQDGGGPLRVLVNNAGIRRDSIVGMMSPDDWEAVLRTNLGGVFAMSKFAVQQMMGNRYGRIINITSPSGRLGLEGQANYAASKAGMVALTKTLSKEVARRKITVNCVSPGFTDTEFIAGLPEEQLKEYKASVPMKRLGTSAEVASAVLFLASEESAYITGAVLEVTGGI